MIIVMYMLEEPNVRVKENVWHYGRHKQVNWGKPLSLLGLWVVLCEIRWCLQFSDMGVPLFSLGTYCPILASSILCNPPEIPLIPAIAILKIPGNCSPSLKAAPHLS